MLALLVVNLPAGVALALGWVGLGFLAWLVALGIGLALGVAWFKVDRAVANLLATFVSSVLLPIPVAAFLVSGLRVATGHHDLVSFDEVLATDADRIAIEDAVVEDELVGERPSEANPGQLPTHHFAAPVVHEAWSSDEPVAVWLRCTGEGDDPRASCEAAWSRRPIVGKVDRTRAEDDASVSDALEKHGLKAPKEIVILRTSARPSVDAWAAVGAVSAIWLLVNALVLALLLWRRKAAARS